MLSAALELQVTGLQLQDYAGNSDTAPNDLMFGDLWEICHLLMTLVIPWGQFMSVAIHPTVVRHFRLGRGVGPTDRNCCAQGCTAITAENKIQVIYQRESPKVGQNKEILISTLLWELVTSISEHPPDCSHQAVEKKPSEIMKNDHCSLI